MQSNRLFFSRTFRTFLRQTRLIHETYSLEPQLPSTNLRNASGYFPRILEHFNYPVDNFNRYIIMSHLFDDTMQMLSALEPYVSYDAIIAVPYSVNRPNMREKWGNQFGHEVVHMENSIAATKEKLKEELDKSLDLCAKNSQQLIIQDCDGFVPEMLHSENIFAKRLHLVKGVVEITSQGVWRARDLQGSLMFPVLSCASSIIKRLEMIRCGETVARCIDSSYRHLGLSLAGRRATVIGGGWVGASVADALKRLDMIPAIIDTDPLKVMEAQLKGFISDMNVDMDWIAQSHLLVGTTGVRSISKDILSALPYGALVASASSRQLEIDVSYLQNEWYIAPDELSKHGIDAYFTSDGEDFRNNIKKQKLIYLINNGFPVNFLPNSMSVPDEIMYPVLAELLVLMKELALADTGPFKFSGRYSSPGVYGISQEQEKECARLWLEMRNGQ